MDLIWGDGGAVLSGKGAASGGVRKTEGGVSGQGALAGQGYQEQRRGEGGRGGTHGWE